jgi:hypothetical protein
MMNTKRLGLLAGAVVVIAAFAGAVAIASSVVERRLSPRPLPDRGTAIRPDDIPALEKEAVRSADGEAPGEVSLMAVRRGRAFYRVHRPDKAPCYAIGPSTAVRFSALACQDDFPSSAHPVLDQSVVMRSYDTSGKEVAARLVAVEGFAAEGVARVAVRDESGETASATVADNVYVVDPKTLPNGRPVEVVAYDADGAVVYRKDLGRG